MLAAAVLLFMQNTHPCPAPVKTETDESVPTPTKVDSAVPVPVPPPPPLPPPQSEAVTRLKQLARQQSWSEIEAALDTAKESPVSDSPRVKRVHFATPEPVSTLEEHRLLPAVSSPKPVRPPSILGLLQNRNIPAVAAAPVESATYTTDMVTETVDIGSAQPVLSLRPPPYPDISDLDAVKPQHLGADNALSGIPKELAQALTERISSRDFTRRKY